MPIVLMILIALLVLFLLALVGFFHLVESLFGLGKDEPGLNVSADAHRAAKRRVSELEAALAEARAKIEALESEARLRTTDVSPADETFKCTIALPPNGREVFVPPLDPNRVYEITVQGQCSQGDTNSPVDKKAGRADALYRTDALGNFVVPHTFLTIGGAPARDFLANDHGAGVSAEDRDAHRYRFRIDGEDKNRALNFCVSLAGLREAPMGSLAMTVECLPSGTLSPAALRRNEEEAKAGAAREDAKRSRLESTLAALRVRAHHESHHFDPVYQENFARSRTGEILGLKAEWATEYRKFVQDADLKRLAEAQAPEVLAWFEARVKIVQLAERLSVAPPPEPKVAEPKPRLNAAQVREIKLRREAVQTDDRIALAKQKAEKLLEAKEQLGDVPLEPEERERIETELIEGILESTQEKDNDENSTTL
jgi:hypothetical protein